MHSYLNISIKILNILKIKYTFDFIEDALLSHPNFPSLLAMSDLFEKFNIENVALQIEKERLFELPLPCILQINNTKEESGASLYILIKVFDNYVVCYNENNERIKISKEKISQLWTGVALLLKKNKNSIQPRYRQKEKEMLMDKSLGLITGICLFIWIIYEISMNFPVRLYSILYLATIIGGLIISGFLFWYEVGKYNPVLQKVCSRGKKMSCESVLNSKYSKILDTELSLSSLSFSFFFGSFMLLLYSSFSYEAYCFLQLLNVLSIPIMIYSIYFQMLIIKQWCKLCLFINGILTLQFTINVFEEFEFIGSEFLKLVPVFLLFFTSSLLVWKRLLPLLKDQKKIKLYKRELGKIKINPIVWHGLLSESNKILSDPSEMGIILKNQNAKYRILKVCNPYCDPCAKSHRILESLYDKGIIDLQILFTARPVKTDYRVAAVSHLLAIYSMGNPKVTRQALSDWYLTKSKSYDVFASKYPINGALDEQWDKIKAMHEWCENQQINHTPTIYIGGNELPSEYTIDDLKDILTLG